MANTVTDRQEIFVQEIVKGTTQRQAYVIAFPAAKNWKISAIDPTASKLLKNPVVAARLAELRQQAQKQNALSRDGVLEQLKQIGFGDIDPDKIRPADKIRALEAIAKIMGFDQVQINIGTIEDLSPIAEMIKKAKERGK